MEKEIMTVGFEFDEAKFNEKIKNHRFLNKPVGGLWGSPVDSVWGWKDWCDSEDFRTSTLHIQFKWKFKAGAKVLVIDSVSDLLNTVKKFPRAIQKGWSYSYLDWERLAKRYDGIHLTDKGFAECRFKFDLGIESWDCESIVAFNRDSIELLCEEGA